MGDRRQHSPWVIVIYVLLALAALTLGIWHRSTSIDAAADLQTQPRLPHRDSPTIALPEVIIAPVRSALNAVGRTASDVWFGLRFGRGLLRENRRLKQQASAAEALGIRLEGMRRENAQLRAALGMASSPSAPQIAEVITVQPSSYFATITVRPRGGAAAVGSAVTAEGGGLVGLVTATGHGAAIVTLITDPSFGVSVRLARDGDRMLGIVRGRGDRDMDISLIDDSVTIQPGDVVITSGVGGVFPAGLPVGVVQTRPQKLPSGERSATIRPLTTAGSLEYVYIYPPRQRSVAP